MGFTLAHAQLIAIAVVVFVILVATQSSLDIKAMFAGASTPEKMLTYESVRTEVLAENGSDSNQDEMNAENARQLAMLNLSDNGEVLGVNSDFPSAEELFSPEMMDKIAIKHSSLNGDAAIKKYADQILYVESAVDVLALLTNMNNEDHSAVEQSQNSAKSMIASMAAVPVPSGLEDYHRYKMMYYTTLINIGDIWLGKRDQSELQDQSKILFSLTEKIESIKASVLTKSSISL